MTFAAVQNMKYLPNKLFAQWYDETWFDLDLSLTGLFFRGFFTLEKFELETFDLEKFIRVTFDLEKFEREFFHLGFFQREFFHLGFFHQEFLGSGKLWIFSSRIFGQFEFMEGKSIHHYIFIIIIIMSPTSSSFGGRH